MTRPGMRVAEQVNDVWRFPIYDRRKAGCRIRRKASSTQGVEIDNYSTYDGSGMRVAEQVNDVWRFLIYDIGGKLVAEYGGPAAMDSGGVKYLMTDWQGSTRAVLNNLGQVKARSDYSAYGESINVGTGLRTSAQGFGSALVPRQKYALTERDAGTGLDHTWFRKHENRAGRWTSPDPYVGSMSLGDPQSFNRYSYVSNQPTNLVDPSGLLTEFTYTYCYVNGDFRNCVDIVVHTMGGGPGEPIDVGGGGVDLASTEPPKSCLTECNRSCLNREEKACAKEGEAKFNELLSFGGAIEAVIALIGVRTNRRFVKQEDRRGERTSKGAVAQVISSVAVDIGALMLSSWELRQLYSLSRSEAMTKRRHGDSHGRR